MNQVRKNHVRSERRASSKSSITRSLAVLVGFIVGATGLNVQAQGTLEEIVVTAQFREQSVQDVPISITAITSSELEAANIFDSASLAVNVPGFSYGEFAPGQALLSIRGVSSADDSAGLDNSVALFLDGVYIGRGAGINFDLFDLERIEVLKGPQGTLFGRNAIGGAISVITAKPTEEFEGKVAATVGNEGIFRFQGLVSGPLSDNLAGKLVVNHREHDGFVENVLRGIDVQDEDQLTVRGQLLWTAGNSEWLLSADIFDDERADAGRVPIAGPFFDGGFAPALGATEARQNASPILGFTNRESGGISLQGDIEFDGGVLTTITAFRSVETDWEMPSIGAPIPGTTNLAAGVFGLDVNDDIEEEVDTFSQEIRWTSKPTDKFSYVAGAYFLVEDTFRQEQFRLDLGTTGQNGVVGNEYTITENETTSYALYGQATWNISDQLKLNFGGRYTRDDREYTATAINCDSSDLEILAAGFANSNNCIFGGNRVAGSLNIINETFIVPSEADFDDFSPTISLQYQPSDTTSLYATISTGYKAGGFAGSQGVASAASTVVDPEEVVNYEIGLKGTYFDNSLRFNISAFTSDYDDLQTTRFGPVPNSQFGTFQTTNVGSADLTGIEMDFTWQITDNFRLSGNYGYLDTEANDLILQTATGVDDFSGLPLRQSPENSYGITANYSLPTSSGTYEFRAQYSHVDENHFDFVTFEDTVAEEFDLLDLRFSWLSSNEKYEVILWSQNVTDEDYIQHSYRIGPGTIGVYGAPRTTGVTAIVNF